MNISDRRTTVQNVHEKKCVKKGWGNKDTSTHSKAMVKTYRHDSIYYYYIQKYNEPYNIGNIHTKKKHSIHQIVYSSNA